MKNVNDIVKRDYGIQVLRGLACIMVVLSHYIGACQLSEKSIVNVLSHTPIRIMWDGTVAVDIFFVLSGFFIYKKSEKINYLGTIQKRFVRLYPAYLGSLILGIVGRITSWRGQNIKGTEWVNSQWQNPLTAGEIIKGFIFFPTFDATTVNGPLWTMKIELMSIFVLPLVCYLCNKIPGILLLIIMVIVAYFFRGSTYVYFLMYLPVYATGMVARKYSDDIVKRIDVKKWILIGILLLEYRWLSSILQIEDGYIVHVITALGVAIVILCVAKLGIVKNIISIIGDYSFYIYLVHFVVMLWFRFIWDDYSYFLYLIICFIVTAIIAYLFKKIFENSIFRHIKYKIRGIN